MVCGGCSAKKFLLPSQSNKAVRVCDACYNALSTAKGRSDYHTGGKYLQTKSTLLGVSTVRELNGKMAEGLRT